jgi:hypothetical protein
MPSAALVVGFAPRGAYTPAVWTVLFTLSGNAICVTLRETPLIVTSRWMCVALPWYQPG